MTKTNEANKVYGTSSLVKPRFGPGMLLQHQDLELLTAYTRDLNRMMFRTLFGCGVVCGLKITPEIKCDKFVVNIDPGMAIACSGDPISVEKKETIEVDRLERKLWVVLCRKAKCCSPRTSMCSSDSDDEAPAFCTREVEGYEITVGASRGCSCGGPEVQGAPTLLDSECKCARPDLAQHVNHYAGECGCSCGGCQQCDCDCVLLGRIDVSTDAGHWDVVYAERRFVRPVLMRDPYTVQPPQPTESEPNANGEAYPAADEAGVPRPPAMASAAAAGEEVKGDVVKQATKGQADAAVDKVAADVAKPPATKPPPAGKSGKTIAAKSEEPPTEAK